MDSLTLTALTTLIGCSVFLVVFLVLRHKSKDKQLSQLQSYITNSPFDEKKSKAIYTAGISSFALGLLLIILVPVALLASYWQGQAEVLNLLVAYLVNLVFAILLIVYGKRIKAGITDKTHRQVQTLIVVSVVFSGLSLLVGGFPKGLMFILLIILLFQLNDATRVFINAKKK